MKASFNEPNYLEACSMATATATVMPTMGLLPAPMRPIISLQKARSKVNQAAITVFGHFIY